MPEFLNGIGPELPVKTNCVQTPTAPVKQKAIDIMKRQLPSQTLEEQFLCPSTRKAPLSESIRLGAQLMLQKAVELEVIAAGRSETGGGAVRLWHS